MGRLPSIEFPSGLTLTGQKPIYGSVNVTGYLPSQIIPAHEGLKLFSTNAAMQLIIPLSEEFKVVNNKWLEWEISQLQVKYNKLI